MSDVVAYITQDHVREWFSTAEEEDDYFLDDLQYESKGSVFEVPGVTDFQFTVEDVFIDTTYNSYGYRSEDGYLVFSVTGLDGSFKLFKLPYRYESYEGGSWIINKITEVVRREKVITTWEWRDVNY